MSIYAIGDLHLSFNENKPMNIFGNNWENHEEKIKTNWLKKIKEDDLIILPGDFSWAMHLEETKSDFEYLDSLPGKKILTKGNHDYWWTTLKSMRDFIKEHQFSNIDFLMNNAYVYENNVIVGTRGWSFNETENSEKMEEREKSRLENSIKCGLELIDNMDNYSIICVMHYPPITKSMIENGKTSEYINIMNRYNIHTCIYAHLHGKSHEEAVEGKIGDLNLQLVSSDYLNFDPIKIQ